MICDAFDVVVTRFPFADRNIEKRRPVLVLSGYETFGRATNVATVAMITTGRASRWPFDVPVGDLDAAGLRHSCVVRFKLATLDYRLFERRLGSFGAKDRRAVGEALRRLLYPGTADPE